MQCALIKCFLDDKELVVARMNRGRITGQVPCTSAAEKDTDWEKCVICQQITTEALKFPAASKRSIDGAGYKTLSDNLLAFKEIDFLPYNMFPWLKVGEDSEETLRSQISSL